MSFNVLVTITGSTSLGPFQIAECTGHSEEGCTGCTDITNPSGVDITVNELTNGHYVNVTNDNTTSIQLTSSGTCDNVICLLIDGKPTLPPTNTPTATPTGTPTATPTSTSTPIPPTSTPIPPTSTPTNTPTSTPIPPTSTPTPTNTPTSTPEPIYITSIIISSTDSPPNGANCDEPNTGLIENYVWVIYNTDWFTIEGGYNVVKSNFSLSDVEIIDSGTVGYTIHPNSIVNNSSTILRSSSDGSYMVADESTQGSGKLLFIKDGVYGTTTKCQTPTPTPTNTPTPTPEPDGICFGYTYTQYDVDNDLLPEVRYRDMSDTIVTTAITGLISVDNNDGTFTGYICVKQGSSYATPICVDGVYEVSCPNTWNEGSSCSSVITCAN